jgi:hypothetical protein
MMATRSKGKMTFTSPTAVALWTYEISGQISDGMWENASPHNHYMFWCRLDVSVGDANALISDDWCIKKNYALTRLHQSKHNDSYILRDRMLACGRMAKAGADPTDHELLSACEYMPETLEQFRTMKSQNSWGHDFIAKYMEKVTDELAEKFYSSQYTLKEMNADLKLIMNVMRTAKM